MNYARQTVSSTVGHARCRHGFVTSTGVRRTADQQLRLQCSRWKSSSTAFSDVPDFVRESVTTTIIDHVTGDNSRLWNQELRHPAVSSAAPLNGINGHHSIPVDHQHSIASGTVNESTSSNSNSRDNQINSSDDLDDLFLTDSTRYWPGLPPNVSPHAEATFGLVQTELQRLAASIRQDLIGTDHFVLNQAASYFFDSAVAADGGKKVRPMMVLLLSRALADSARHHSTPDRHDVADTVANDNDQEASLFTSPLPWQRRDLPAAQRRLAEISEMIHTASLFHDDVIDGADTRRGVPAVHMVFGNKMAILAGDYLLARASICLARLRHVEVVETMSTIIEHLVRGEVMQLRNNNTTTRGSGSSNISTNKSEDRMDYYLRKNFYKTGSLMANSCKSAALLGDYSADFVDASYRYGKHVGMAFQLVDDVLDFEGTLSQLGKPALGDLKAGLATAPVLFAAEEFPELDVLMDRKFKETGDVEQAVHLVFQSSGIERTKELARVHAEYAMDALLRLHPSESRDALIHLANKVVARTK